MTLVADEAAAEGLGGFVSADAEALVNVVIVTYNNRDSIGPLMDSLRHEARTLTMRVVVVDNSSADDTAGRVREAYRDVKVVHAGGNLGYAAGINIGMRALPSAEFTFVVNPDALIDAGCIGALVARARETAAGVVAPKLLGADGRLAVSLFREPTVLGTLGDGVFGSRWSNRPGWLSEIVYDSEDYQFAHVVDWAAGAAMLISRQASDAVGEWDERYFLYSEETDFQRRLRQSGMSVWYEPNAVVRHTQGGSGGSPDQYALLAVNRVRYVRRYRGRAYAATFRGAAIVWELMRAKRPWNARALRALLSEQSWSSLPNGTGRPAGGSGS
ncbi:glycosyltransferase family 2 protein [Gryllotalpicola protaetiae]|nr:glycosyltransferase family 2 protein [Gryllotalpicola protaetiae]